MNAQAAVAVQLTPPQAAMLRRLARWATVDAGKHGPGEDWQQLSEMVMVAAEGLPSGIGWTTANRIFGALERKGCIEHHAVYDDLVRVSASGHAALITKDDQ